MQAIQSRTTVHGHSCVGWQQWSRPDSLPFVRGATGQVWRRAVRRRRDAAHRNPGPRYDRLMAAVSARLHPDCADAPSGRRSGYCQYLPDRDALTRNCWSRRAHNTTDAMLVGAPRGERAWGYRGRTKQRGAPHLHRVSQHRQWRGQRSVRTFRWWEAASGAGRKEEGGGTTGSGPGPRAPEPSRDRYCRHPQGLVWYCSADAAPARNSSDQVEPAVAAHELVPGAGLEPARLAARDFKSLASTDFATRALSWNPRSAPPPRAAQPRWEPAGCGADDCSPGTLGSWR